MIRTLKYYAKCFLRYLTMLSTDSYKTSTKPKTTMEVALRAGGRESRTVKSTWTTLIRFYRKYSHSDKAPNCHPELNLKSKIFLTSTTRSGNVLFMESDI